MGILYELVSDGKGNGKRSKKKFQEGTYNRLYNKEIFRDNEGKDRMRAVEKDLSRKAE